jgi:hypothetical protein
MIALALVLAGLLTAEAAAADPPDMRPDLRVGFDGIYRTGSWTPLTLEFPSSASNPPQAVCVWVEDPDGQYVRSPVVPVEVGADGRPVARLSVRFGRPTARALVETLPGTAGGASDRGQTAAVPQSLPPPIPATESVMLVLGELPAAERASRLLAKDDGTRPRVVTISPRTIGAGKGAGAGGAAALGRTARAFDGADSIVVCGRSVAAFDPAVLQGVDAWVRQGGQLVFIAGMSSLDVERGGTAAAAWLPGPVAKLVPLRRGNAIETYARASRPLDKGAFTGLEQPLFKHPQAIDGSVEAFEGRGPADLPLVVRRAHGLGTLVWVGLDIDQAPFRDWSGSDSLLVEMLRGRRATQDAGRAGETNRGSLDLTGQLRQAIDRFPGVAPIPFEVIAGLGILYVACLYPLDWWLVSGWRRGSPASGPGASWVAWVSLPLVVAAASGLAWSAGQRFKGTNWQTSAASLVDLDVASGLVRVASFAGIWSPINARLDLAVAADQGRLSMATADTDAAQGAATREITWFAACSRGIGGTDAPSPHPSLAAANYEYGGSAAALDGIPIAASSSRLFEAEITGHMPTPAVDSTLAREGQGTLRGVVTSRLPFPLEGCVLAHAGWLYEVGPLGPGQSFDTGTGRGPRSLAGALTRRTQVKDREINVRWDVAERDPLRILEIAGFHAAAGGSSYTSLESGRLARLDLSPLLPLDRAVLVGRGPGLVDWQCHTQSLASTTTSSQVPPMNGQTAMWRIVIPLGQPTTAAPGSPPTANTSPSPH